jgi:hypothetical protein
MGWVSWSPPPQRGGGLINRRWWRRRKCFSFCIGAGGPGDEDGEGRDVEDSAAVLCQAAQARVSGGDDEDDDGDGPVGLVNGRAAGVRA